MKQSIVVLSLVSSNIPEEQCHFAALRVEKGHTPRYLIFSLAKDWVDVDKYSSKIEEIFKDSVVFVFDKSTVSLFKKLFGIKLKSKKFIDVRELLILFYPSLSQYGLQELSTKIEMKKKLSYFSPAHQEVRFIWGVLKNCWLIGLNSDLGLISRLEEYTKGLSCEQFVGFLKKEIIKKFPDRPISTALYPKETGINLFAENSEVQAEGSLVTADEVINCFQEGGLLSKNFPGYEQRALQATMAEAIIKGFTESQDIIIEAGTGTGKSLAYLIPALWWAKKERKKVIVATHTITLQEQLFYKDLPFLQKILPFKFKTALLKGKSNYICLKSFNLDNLNDESSPNERLAYTGVFSWIRETLTGDFSEISYLQRISFIGRKYGADNPYCQPGECQFAGQCYLLKARRKAEDADLIVINHSLLLADIKTNHRILPEYSDLIIDEAHNLYQTALKQLGFEISFEQIRRTLENLVMGRGSLLYLAKKNKPFWLEVYPAVNWTEFYINLERIAGCCDQVTDQAKELFNLCQEILAGRLNIRLDESKQGRSVFSAFLIIVENLLFKLKDLIEVLNKLNSCLVLESEQLESIKFEILKNKNDFTQITDGLKDILTNDEDTRVTYLEKSGVIYLKNTFVDIVEILRKKVFSKNNSTILTSATLTVAEKFDYFARDIGVENYHSLKLESPFDYDKQMLFCVVNDIQVNQFAEEVLAAKAACFIKRIAEVMDGRTLVLFTSHRYLRLVHEQLMQTLLDSDLSILGQGIDGTREALLQEFRKNKQSILLGTSSFWEGIDIPGESLRCVIMTKLPFWPPDSPILEAKARLLESQGQDPFNDLHLPEAIIRFKQGFGRLIRTKNDKGVVILLDNRIIKKYYGRSFIKSLPILSYFQGNSEKVIVQVGNWV